MVESGSLRQAPLRLQIGGGSAISPSCFCWMQWCFAKLVGDFEVGKLTRRELIKSLTRTMAAAPIMDMVLGASSEMKGFRATAVNHISYQVADYAKTRDFYGGLFGMQVSHDDGKQCFLAFGDTFVIPRNRSANTPRIDHIAYTIENWDKNVVEMELKRRGLKPEPDTDNSFHVEDPNGFDLQICGKDMKP